MKRQAKKKQPEIEDFIPIKPKAWKITELEEVHVKVFKMDILDFSPPPHDAEVYIQCVLDNRAPVKTKAKSSSGGSTTFFDETLKIYLRKDFTMTQCMMKVQVFDSSKDLNDALGEVEIDLSWVLNGLPRRAVKSSSDQSKPHFTPFQLTNAESVAMGNGAMGTIYLAFCHVQRTNDELAEPAEATGTESSLGTKCLRLRAPAPWIAHADDTCSFYTAEGEDEKRFSSSDLEQHEEESWQSSDETMRNGIMIAEETQTEVIIRQPTADHYFYNNLIIIDSQRLAASPTEELATWIAKTGTT